jgi:hypothetical protein
VINQIAEITCDRRALVVAVRTVLAFAIGALLTQWARLLPGLPKLDESGCTGICDQFVTKTVTLAWAHWASAHAN